MGELVGALEGRLEGVLLGTAVGKNVGGIVGVRDVGERVVGLLVLNVGPNVVNVGAIVGLLEATVGEVVFRNDGDLVVGEDEFNDAVGDEVFVGIVGPNVKSGVGDEVFVAFPVTFVNTVGANVINGVGDEVFVPLFVELNTVGPKVMKTVGGFVGGVHQSWTVWLVPFASII